MNNWPEILNEFIKQAHKGELKTASYPKEWEDLRMRISFGMGMPARVPWIAFLASGMEVSNGYYPVYLYYKDSGTLILAYGISETKEFGQTWPDEIMNSSTTINDYLESNVPRYGDSFVYKSYKVSFNGENIKFSYPEHDEVAQDKDISFDLKTVLEYYKKVTLMETSSPTSALGQGLFYMEKQLEDFIIHNWENTELGKKYDLIVEEGELISQQYRTEIGPIDILAKDKVSKNFVVIELKKNQTSDDTVGQLARYMGWIKRNKDDRNVKGIIIVGQ